MKKIPYVLLFVFFLMPFLTGCASADLGSNVYGSIPSGASTQQGTFKVGNPYKAEGRWYRPKETYSYSEVGTASWYGDEFHGRKTANGEIFNKNEMTAAHRTLQMPSLVRVTNLENGKSVVVRVNDRGPFARNRIIDVSHRAAQELGFIGTGTAKVRIDVLSEESRRLSEMAKQGQNTRGTELAHNNLPAGQNIYQPHQSESVQPEIHPALYQDVSLTSPAAGVSSNMYVQAGSFSDPVKAQTLAAQLSGFGSVNVYQTDLNGRHLYRVRLGPLGGLEEANSVMANLSRAGHYQTIIVID